MVLRVNSHCTQRVHINTAVTYTTCNALSTSTTPFPSLDLTLKTEAEKKHTTPLELPEST